MIIHDYDIKCKGRSDKFYVIPIGDVHYGCVNSDIDRLKANIKWIKDNKNVYWLGMGDLIEAITYSDVRFDPSNHGENDLSNTVYQQLTDVAKMFLPIANRCLGLLEGNHEEKIRLRDHISPIDILCEKIWTASGKKIVIKNLTSCAYVRLRFIRQKNTGKLVDIWCHHGYSAGRTIGADINALMRASQGFDADIFLCGHSHKKIVHEGETLYVTRSKRSLKLLARKILYGITGCFYQTYKEGGSRSYGEKKAYPPTPLGVVKILIEPHRNSKKNYEAPVHLHISA